MLNFVIRMCGYGSLLVKTNERRPVNMMTDHWFSYLDYFQACLSLPIN